MLCKQSEIKKRRARRQRRWWMKKIHHNRTRQFIEEKFNELLYEPSGEFDNFCRMSYSDFEFLLQKISPMISKHDTDFREAIPAKFRLAITLRFLASGDSYKSLHYLFKVSVPMISIIIREVCRALNEILKDLVKSSFDVYDSSGNMVTPGSWRRDNDEYNALQNLPQIPRRSPVNAREQACTRREITMATKRGPTCKCIASACRKRPLICVKKPTLDWIGSKQAQAHASQAKRPFYMLAIVDPCQGLASVYSVWCPGSRQFVTEAVLVDGILIGVLMENAVSQLYLSAESASVSQQPFLVISLL
ncbi:hypothetical protein HW555_004482 [Spodoptera exigua]|uniref:Protein ANTAGONIST OF LIKE HETEROCHROMATIN PROTEIN 1-like n=1 Tax=Spodoptera exigua TaxID=7107 RepID=A0A835L667_SPOEX|nr:hypothetical protein HW555_004482 [Spodoptera exigua]